MTAPKLTRVAGLAALAAAIAFVLTGLGLEIITRILPTSRHRAAVNDSATDFVIRVRSNRYPAVQYGYALPAGSGGIRFGSEIEPLVGDAATYELLSTDCVVLQRWTSSAGAEIRVASDETPSFWTGPFAPSGDTGAIERTDDCVP